MNYPCVNKTSLSFGDYFPCLKVFFECLYGRNFPNIPLFFLTENLGNLKSNLANCASVLNRVNILEKIFNISLFLQL